MGIANPAGPDPVPGVACAHQPLASSAPRPAHEWHDRKTSFYMEPGTGTQGYALIDCHAPSKDLIQLVRAEVNDRLPDFQDVTSDEHGYGILGWGSQCASFFRTHEEVRADVLIRRNSLLELTSQFFKHPFFVNQVGDDPESSLYSRGVACFIKKHQTTTQSSRWV